MKKLFLALVLMSCSVTKSDMADCKKLCTGLGARIYMMKVMASGPGWCICGDVIEDEAETK